MKEVFLIVNPIAGGGRCEKIWHEEIKPLIKKNNIEYEYEFTKHPQHAIEIAETRVNEGYRIVCSVGGDGTANEVLNGILKAKKTGIFSAIPIGTGNDVPTVFGIPEEDLEAEVHCLVSGKDKRFDVGYCETADRHFAGVASMGFDAEVADRTNKGSKRLSGTKNYQIALVKTLVKFKPYSLLIGIDENPNIEDQIMLLAIGNGKRYGGGMHICPTAEINNGKFGVTTLKKIGRITLLRLFRLVYDGNHIKHRKVGTYEGTAIHVDSPKRKCLYQIDGEIMGFLPETFITKPKALIVRVPDPWLSYSEVWLQKLNKKKKNQKE